MNISESSIFQHNDQDNELDNLFGSTNSGTKRTELYNKQLQYRNILSRDNTSTNHRIKDKTKQIEQCKTIDELKTLYTEMHKDCEFIPRLIPKFYFYIAFMDKAILLDPIFYWHIFEELKQKFLHEDCVYRSKDICIVKLFNIAMLNAVNGSLDKTRGITHLFNIYDEFKNLCNDETNTWYPNLPYYPSVLTRIISCCTMMGYYGKSKDIIDDIFVENRETFIYEQHQQIKLWNSILNYCSKKRDLDGMEMYFKKMTGEYNVHPDDVTFNIRINAFAKMFDARFESIFTEYIEEFNRYPKLTVFLALLNGYSFSGDITSCIDVLNLLLSRNDRNNSDVMRSSLPKVNFTVFVPIFKALMCSKTVIECEYGWKLVVYLLGEMEKANVEPNEIIYGIIFSLCGTSFFNTASMDQLNFYYKEMTEKYNLKPEHTQFKNILKSGVQYYASIDSVDEEERKNVTLEKYGFVKWWKQEMDKYKVSINNELKHILINASCIGCI